SHNMSAIRTLCSSCIFLKDGVIHFQGATSEAVRMYMAETSQLGLSDLGKRKDRDGDGRIRFTDFWLEDENGNRTNRLSLGQAVRFCFSYHATQKCQSVYVAFDLEEEAGNPLINCNTGDVGLNFEQVPMDGTFVCELKSFPLRAARYVGNLFCAVNGITSDWV